MRTNFFSTDMDFRVIPTTLPLQSPSPDRKSINSITPTISPNALQIKKASTPIKNTSTQKQSNKKNILQLDTQIKYHSQIHPNPIPDESSGTLKQKDAIISNLQNIIKSLTQNNQQKSSNQQQQRELKKQIKTLTIQNQKLISIIEKYTNKTNLNSISNQKIQQYENRIKQLEKIIKQNQQFYKEENKQLKRFNKNLNSQLRSLENQKNQLENENKKLLKILTEKSQAQKNNEKLKVSTTSQQSHQQKNMTGSKSQQRITITKIRQQHAENLRMLKESLTKEIQQTFNKMQVTLQDIMTQVHGLYERLELLQKIGWDRIKKTQFLTQSIKISIREGPSRQQTQEDVTRSYVPSNKNNSQIFIDEGPPSSYSKTPREQYSRIEEIQLAQDKKYKNPLQQELIATKRQLHELKQKYQKLAQSSSLLYSNSDLSQKMAQTQRKYKLALEELSKKDKEISILYQQVRNIEEQNLSQLSKKQGQIKDKQNQLQKLYLMQVQNKDLLLKIHKLTEQMKVSEQNWAKMKKSLEHELQNIQQDYENSRKRREQIQQDNVLKISQLSQQKLEIQWYKSQISLKNQQSLAIKQQMEGLSERLIRYEEENKKLRNLLEQNEKYVIKLRQILAQYSNSNLLEQIDQLKKLISTADENLQQKSKKLSEQRHILSQKIAEIGKLREQNFNLRKYLNEKQGHIIELLAKVKQLQNLYGLNKQKLEEQEKLYQQLIGKMAQNEKIVLALKIQNEKSDLHQNSQVDRQALLSKIQQIRNIQQQRFHSLQQFLLQANKQ